MPPVLPLVASHLTGPHLVLDPLTEADAAELGEILMQPELYAHGYVMHHRPLDADDALAMALERFAHASVPTGSGPGPTRSAPTHGRTARAPWLARRRHRGGGGASRT